MRGKRAKSLRRMVTDEYPEGIRRQAYRLFKYLYKYTAARLGHEFTAKQKFRLKGYGEQA